MRFSFFIFLILFSSQRFYAQEGQIPDAQKVLDSLSKSKGEMLPADSILTASYTTDNAVDRKSLRPDFQKDYRAKEYNYELIKPQESLWERIKRNIARILSRIFGDMDPATANRYTFNVLRLVGIVAVGFLLYFLIKYLMSKDGNFFFSKKNKSASIKADGSVENIHDINFSDVIQKLELQKDYRSAIRYQFLRYLKLLSDKNKIKWLPEKTNQDYARELKEENVRKHFSSLAYIFDNAWYGEFPVSERDYAVYKDQFLKTGF